MVSIDVNNTFKCYSFVLNCKNSLIITYRNAKLEQRFKLPDLNLAYLRRLATVNSAKYRKLQFPSILFQKSY